MLTGKTLCDFAELALKIGVNLQKGQGLEIVCPTEKSDVAEAIALKAYEIGAKIVRVRWENDKTDRINYLHADKDALCEVPKWYVDSKNYLLKNDFCYIAIAAEDPSAFKDVPENKLAAVAKARGKKLKKYFDEVMANGIRWCVISVPTEDWAKQVFPNTENPSEKLSAAIEKTMRLDKKDPVKEWRKHIEKLNVHAQFLNDANFEYLHFENGKGTDLYVGLAIDHVWISAEEKAKDGVPFVANMPTEEVFTAPHNKKIDGVVKSALPLCYNGQIIDDFSLTFKKGRIVDFSAGKGYGLLKNLINTDSGTKSLGEVALIGKNSPIAQSKILFYNTLFDENASCHIAIGQGYPTTVKNGENLSAKEKKEKGLNDSIEHVDFMIGTPDLKVTGITFDGKQIPVFRNGEWVI
ncbi:MAG: aminopeptidase [Clostridia bacterium]|nr:aminopeptidase [Clostridia bacterium]